MARDARIDWEHLAWIVGALEDTSDGRRERASTQLACAALEHVIGVERLAAAVEHYVAGGAGSELARSVLWHLRPWSAMQRCYQLYRSANQIDDRRRAVELLRVVGDARVLPWIGEFLRDADLEIQAWGVGVLDQLLWSELVPAEACEDLLGVAENHSNEAVRERAAFIRGFLADRDSAG